MTDYELHEPDYLGTSTAEWSAPQLQDFDTDDLAAVDDHFLLSSSGFPPENFQDLEIPVVAPDGDLNRNALQTARRTGHGIEAVEDLDESTAEQAKELVDRFVEAEFPDAEATGPPSN